MTRENAFMVLLKSSSSCYRFSPSWPVLFPTSTDGAMYWEELIVDW